MGAARYMSDPLFVGLVGRLQSLRIMMSLHQATLARTAVSQTSWVTGPVSCQPGLLLYSCWA